MKALRAAVAALALGIASFSIAAEPQDFAQDAFAQPIAATATPLRWKSKQVAPTRMIATSTAFEPQQPAAPAGRSRGWNKTRMDGQVRPVQAIADPFADPFGDRGAVRAAADIELEPTEAESGRSSAAPTTGVEELPAPAPRQLRSITAPRATAIDETYTLRQPTPELGPAAPAPDILPSKSGAPCDRIYNDRNCCDIESGCKAFREQLASDSIRNISLDITPRYMPDLSLAEDEASRTDKLRLLEMRPWLSRRGEVLANGRMTNLQSGRVIVSDEAGTEVARIPWDQLGEDELCYINAFWRLPVECALGGREVVSRNWLASTYQWHASALCHKPLYFEEVQLERYGHTTGPFTQPFVSGAHFFLNLAVLPYHMGYQPPHECQYALGYYRPGSCAPWMIPPVPLSLRGAAAETAAVLGGIYLIP